MFPPPYVHEKMRARKDVLLSPPQYVDSFTAFFVRRKKVLGCDAMHHRPFSWPTIDTWNEGPVWSVPYLAPHGLTERLAVIPALVMWGAGGTVEEHPKRNQSSEADRRVGPPHCFDISTVSIAYIRVYTAYFTCKSNRTIRVSNRPPNISYTTHTM